eukprot:12323215-Prorocentrum_lima.AAC.1
MHPSVWLIINGKKRLKEVKMAQPAPENKCAETRGRGEAWNTQRELLKDMELPAEWRENYRREEMN